MQQRQQQQQQGIQDRPHGPGAYNLGLEIGQHVDIIAVHVYRRHRYLSILSCISGSDSYTLIVLVGVIDVDVTLVCTGIGEWICPAVVQLQC